MSIYESYDKIIHMFSCSDNYTSDLQNLQKLDSDMCRTYKIRFGHVQNLRKSIRTCAELTKTRFGHVQNLQNSIRTCAELTKINSDMCRTYKNQFGHVQNLQNRSKYSSKFGQMHAPRIIRIIRNTFR